jgi:hypothetical protein
MATYREKISTIAIQQETTEGTAISSALTATVKVMNLEFSPEIMQTPHDAVADLFGTFPSIPGMKKATTSFDVYPIGASTLVALGGSGCEVATLLQACGGFQTLTGSTSARYDFPETTTTTLKTLTIRPYFDGKYFITRGNRGNIRISGKTGAPILFSFSFLGAFDHEEVDDTMQATSYSTVTPAPLLSASAAIGGTSLTIRSFEINIDNGLHLKESINNADGYVSTVITNPVITGSIVFEPEAVGTFNPNSFDRVEDGTANAFTVLSGSGTTANKLTISSPSGTVQMTGVRPVKDNGLLLYAANLQFNRSSGDDALRLLWSA